jgi:hypothetical protein
MYSTFKNPGFGPSTVRTKATIMKLILSNFLCISQQVGAERKIGSPGRRCGDIIKMDFM